MFKPAETEEDNALIERFVPEGAIELMGTGALVPIGMLLLIEELELIGGRFIFLPILGMFPGKLTPIEEALIL